MKKLEKWLFDWLVKCLQREALRSVRELEEFDETVRRNNLQNEQWFLDWQDDLNRISTR